MFGALAFAFLFYITVKGDLAKWLGLLGLGGTPTTTATPGTTTSGAGTPGTATPTTSVPQAPLAPPSPLAVFGGVTAPAFAGQGALDTGVWD